MFIAVYLHVSQLCRHNLGKLLKSIIRTVLGFDVRGKKQVSRLDVRF